MKIQITPTCHDSCFINGEDKNGEKDWMRHNSASAEFNVAGDDGENPFTVLSRLIVLFGYGEETVKEWLEDAVESANEKEE